MTNNLVDIGCNFSNEFLMTYDHKEDCKVLMDPREIGWEFVYGGFMLGVLLMTPCLCINGGNQLLI